MTLTKSDLNQIKNIVSQEATTLGQKLEEKLEQKLEEKLEEKLKPIKKDLRYLRKTVDLVVKNYDEGDVRLDRRVKRIEHHLGI